MPEVVKVEELGIVINFKTLFRWVTLVFYMVLTGLLWLLKYEFSCGRHAQTLRKMRA